MYENFDLSYRVLNTARLDYDRQLQAKKYSQLTPDHLKANRLSPVDTGPVAKAAAIPPAGTTITPKDGHCPTCNTPLVVRKRAPWEPRPDTATLVCILCDAPPATTKRQAWEPRPRDY